MSRVSRAWRSGLICVLLLLSGCNRIAEFRARRAIRAGDTFQQTGDLASARREYQRAASLAPNDPDVHLRLGMLAWNDRDLHRADSELEAALNLGSDSPEAYLQVAKLQLGWGDLADARKNVETVLRSSAAQVDAHVLLAEVYCQLEQWEIAEAEAAAIGKLDPKRPEPYLIRARIAAAQHYAPRALDLIRHAIELRPDSPAALEQLGRWHESQCHSQEAEESFRRAVDAAPRDLGSYLRLAAFYTAHSQWPQAEETARHAAAVFPASPEAARLLADVYVLRGLYGAAADEYQRRILAHPDDRRMRQNAVAVLILADRLDQAGTLNSQLVDKAPSDPEVLLHAVQLEWMNGHAQVASDDLKQLLGLQPDNPSAHFFRALVLEMVGWFGDAEVEFDRAAKLSGTHPSTSQSASDDVLARFTALERSSQPITEQQPLSCAQYARAAEIEVAGGATDRAEAMLKKAIEVDPDNPLGYSRMAALRASQKNYAEADRLFAAALQRQPGFADAITGLAAMYLAQGQPQRALALIHSSAAQDAREPAYPYVLAQIAIAQGDLDAADAALGKSLALAPNYVKALRLRVDVRSKMGNYRAAVAAAEDWLRRAGSIEAQMRLAELYDQNGDAAKAQEQYRTILGVEPQNTRAASELALSMLDNNGDIIEAFKIVQQAAQLQPACEVCTDALGWAYYRRGLFDSARGLLEEVVERNPSNSRAQYHLGMALQALNQHDDAATHLRKAVELSPGSAHAVEAAHALDQLGAK